jgi:hypothetical protein
MAHEMVAPDGSDDGRATGLDALGGAALGAETALAGGLLAGAVPAGPVLAGAVSEGAVLAGPVLASPAAAGALAGWLAPAAADVPPAAAFPPCEHAVASTATAASRISPGTAPAVPRVFFTITSPRLRSRT